MSLRFNSKGFMLGARNLSKRMDNAVHEAVNEVGFELLRLSSREVPHDTGLLQNSGSVEDRGLSALVGYNKVYAARLHEHPEYRFQKGRKGKYLEDPLKNNLRVFKKHIEEKVGGALK